MVKRHLKRIATPRRWHIKRKEECFITRPTPGAHSMDIGMSLNTILKDIIKAGKTTKEIKAILNNKEVLVDGKRRKNHRHLIGFMDVLEIPETKQAFRVTFDTHGRITAISIDPKEAKLKLSRIKDKSIVSGGKVQLNLSGGRNLIVDKDEYKTFDSLLIELPTQKIKTHIPQKEGSLVFLIGGKHEGIKAKLTKIQGDTITVIDEKGKEMTTLRKNAFVIGEDKEVISITQ